MGGITVDQEVRWFLAEKLLHIRTGPVLPHDDVISRRSRALATFGSTLEALRYVDAISEEESMQWRNKMWRAVGLEPPEVGEPGTIRMIYLGEGEPPQPERINLVPQFPRKVSGPSETHPCLHRLPPSRGGRIRRFRHAHPLGDRANARRRCRIS